MTRRVGTRHAVGGVKSMNDDDPHRRRLPDQAKAEMPVRARPTMRLLISYDPS